MRKTFKELAENEHFTISFEDSFTIKRIKEHLQ